MDAIIRREASITNLAMADVAGRPLLARQIQWLHAIGCDRIVVEVKAQDRDAVRWLDQHAASFGPSLGVLFVDGSPDVEVVLERSGLPQRGPVIILPGGVLGDCDLARALPLCGSGGAVVHIEPPRGSAPSTRSGAVRIRLPGTCVPHVTSPGWAIALSSAREAEQLGWAALERKLPAYDAVEHPSPIQVHAAEVSPGIWLARGARVEGGARLVAPVLVGEGAIVDAGAAVGPSVVVGARAAVSRGVAVREQRIPEATIIGPKGHFSFAEEGSLLRALAALGKNALLGRPRAGLAYGV